MTQQFTHINETARALNISPSTLYRLAREGQVPHVRIGKRYLFLIDDIVARMRVRQPQLTPRAAPPPPIPVAAAIPSMDTLTKRLAAAADALAQIAQQIELMRRPRDGAGHA